MGEENAKGNDDKNEIFLDKITRKNKVKPENFKPDDIKALKSLLDVSSITLWKKSSSSKVEKNLRKNYKEFYKKVSKSLDSLQKHCKEIKKFEASTTLKTNISTYKNSKEEIEKAMNTPKEGNEGNKEKAIVNKEKAKFSYKTCFQPIEVDLIRTINTLTNEFNKYRRNDPGFVEFMSRAKINPHILTYTEFEKTIRKVSKSKDPFLLKIDDFIKYNIDRRDKEYYAMEGYVNEVFDNHIEAKKDAWNNLCKKLDDLEELLSVKGKNKVDLTNFISEKGDKEIGEDFGKAILEACQVKLEIEYGLSKEAAEKFIGDMGKEISGKGILSTVGEVVGNYAVKFKNTVNWACNWVLKWCNGDSSKKKEEDKDNAQDNAQDDVDLAKIEGITEEIRKIGEAFLDFREANVRFLDLVRNKLYGREKDNIKDIDAEYKSYILKVQEAAKTLQSNAYKGMFETALANKINYKENDDSEKNDNSKKNYNSEEMKILKENEYKNKVLSDKVLNNVSNFVKAINAITSEIPKIKKEYRDAQDDADEIKKLIKYYIRLVKNRCGVNIIGRDNMKGWKPPGDTSKLKLSQAIPYVYYCVNNYEENGFGLNEDIVEVIEESERVKFGKTLRDIKQELKSQNVIKS